MASNINTGHAKGRRSTKKGHVATKPHSGPVTVTNVHPLALQRAWEIAHDVTNSYTHVRVIDGSVFVR